MTIVGSILLWMIILGVCLLYLAFFKVETKNLPSGHCVLSVSNETQCRVLSYCKEMKIIYFLHFAAAPWQFLYLYTRVFRLFLFLHRIDFHYIAHEQAQRHYPAPARSISTRPRLRHHWMMMCERSEGTSYVCLY